MYRLRRKPLRDHVVWQQVCSCSALLLQHIPHEFLRDPEERRACMYILIIGLSLIALLVVNNKRGRLIFYFKTVYVSTFVNPGLPGFQGYTTCVLPWELRRKKRKGLYACVYVCRFTYK